MEKPVEERIKEMIVERLFLSVKPGDIADDADLMETLGVDSVQVFELVVGCEEMFGISFAEDDFDLKAFSTVKGIAGVVRRKLDRKGGT